MKVEPSPERQLRGDVSLQGKRRAMPRTTNQTTLLARTRNFDRSAYSTHATPHASE